MKKLRALFAILLALCMLCSMAFAEEYVTEEIEAPAANEEAALAGESEETTSITAPENEEKIEDKVTEPTPAPADGKDHTTDTPSTYAVVEIHKGEYVSTADLLEGKIADAKVIQPVDCGKGQYGIYRFPCQLKGEDGQPLKDEDGNPVWHERIIPAEHVWASEQHQQNDDWGKVTTEPTCTEKGEAIDFCLVCGTTRDVKHPIDALGHSFENVDDQRVNLVVIKEPTCLNDAKGNPLKDGSVAFECVICGAQTKAIAIDRNDMYALISGDLTDAASLKTVAATYEWANQAAFQKKYADWTHHDWDKWITEKAATCAAGGHEVRWCKRCGIKVERDTLPLVASYKLNNSLTKVLDCYHEAQVWECEYCKGTCKDHPNMIKVRRVVAHEKDERIAAIIDAAVADPTVTELVYKIGDNEHQVYKEATCEEPGYVYYLCKHEIDADHGIVKAEIAKSYEDLYPKANWKLFEAADADKVIGKIQKYDVNGLKVGEAEEVKLGKKYPGPFSAKSYDETVFTAYDHKQDVYPKAGPTKGVKGYYINEFEPALSYFGKTIPAKGHDWSEWLLRYDKDANKSGNEYGYWVRVCKVCGKTEEMVASTNPACKNGHDFKVVETKAATCTAAGEVVSQCTKCGTPKTEVLPALGHIEKVLPAVAATTEAAGKTEGKICDRCGEVLVAQTEIPQIVKNEYAIDLSNVTKGAETRGTGSVTLTGNEEVPALYARVTWVYELANGDSFAYCAMKEVKSAEEALTFNMVSPKQPYGATLVDVQIALVTDAEADASGSYNALATAKK